MAGSKSIHEKLNADLQLIKTSQSTQSLLVAQPSNKSTSIDLYNAANIANLKDLQVYILKRLDDHKILKSKFSNQTNSIEMLNLLLIKSNYCVLYVEKVFDLIVHDLMLTSEIKDIPATLNGLYLYLMQKILAILGEKLSDSTLNLKDLLYTIFGVAFVGVKAFSKEEILEKLKFRFFSLDSNVFETVFGLIEPVLFRRLNAASHKNVQNVYLTFFHSSIFEWFTDVKYCTPTFLLNLSESHFVLSNYYFDQVQEIQDDEDIKEVSLNDS